MCFSAASLAGADAVSGGGMMQGAGSVINAISAIQMGKARREMMEADAAEVQRVAADKAKRIRRAGEYAVGNTRSAAVASGVSLTSQSVLEAERQTVQNVEQDAGLVLVTGANQARALRLSGKFYERAARNQAMESLLSGGSRWGRTRQAGGGGGARDPYADLLASNRGMGD